MTAQNNPAPRANAGSRANSKIKPKHNKSFALNWETEAAAVWLASASWLRSQALGSFNDQPH